MSKNENKSQYYYDSINAFEGATTLPEGTHHIPMQDDLTLDILIGGDLGTVPEGMKIPLFLTGAVTNRETKTGPFFSGERISYAIGTPFVSIADPLVTKDDTTGLAWYTGTPAAPALSIIGRVVTKISWFFERNILAIGGSGGGFASLALAAKSPDVTAFVWNPQTNILEYNPSTVKRYLEAMFGGDWSDDEWKLRGKQRLDEAGVDYDLAKMPVGKNILYLQNDTDWHVAKHCAPFIDSHQLTSLGAGMYSDGGGTIIQLGNFGEGHQPPSKQLIQDTIVLLQPDDSSTADALAGLKGKGYLDDTDPDSLPSDLRSNAEFLKDLRLDVTTEDGTNFICQVIQPTPKAAPLKYRFRGLKGEQRIGGSHKRTRSDWTWSARAIDRIECEIWDGFDNHLGTIDRVFARADFS